MGFVTRCSDALNGILPHEYVAHLNARRGSVHLTDVELRRLGWEYPPGRFEVEVRDVWIEIWRLPRKAAVTVIEVLGPFNKIGQGFDEYNRVRRARLGQYIHLVELDLLLMGERLAMDRALPLGDFHALIARADQRPNCVAYSWTLRDPLPSIPIPLSPPDADALLDLGPAFASQYELGRYDRLIDYSITPTIVENAADRAWAQRIARAARR